MMFYRKDIFDEYGLEIPNTWDDVISLIPDKLITYNLFVPRTSGEVVNLPPNPIYSSMFYQNGGEFYINGNTESGFNEGIGPGNIWKMDWVLQWLIICFRSKFSNRFRSGEMPLGITYYTYNTLSVFAPEIREMGIHATWYRVHWWKR